MHSVDHSQRGATAEAMVAEWAIRNDYVVLFPVFGQQPPFDLVLVGDTAPRRVQVKRLHVRKRGNGDELRADIEKRKGYKACRDDVDMYAFVDPPTRRIWMIPKVILGDINSVAMKTGKYDSFLVQNEDGDQCR